jgi:N-acetylglucosaminyldiphosphoundecaprenol N-acetyl-beta-D-mannosaminyltransferase
MESINLLDVRIHKFDRSGLLEAITTPPPAGKQVFAYVNIKSMNLACEIGWYHDFLNQADYVFCDGMGVVLGARLAGQSISRVYRHTCPDWTVSLAQSCLQKQLSLFVLAGEPEVAARTQELFKEHAPGLKVAVHHGHFDQNGEGNNDVIHKINDFQPDILLVGMGTPLQEKWVLENKEHLQARTILPIGACMDFFTGRHYRGPDWLTGNGFEWLIRLATEPRRLWRRYLLGIPKFYFRVLGHRLGFRVFRTEPL